MSALIDVRVLTPLSEHGISLVTVMHAPSKDIASSFAVQESIRFTFSGSSFNPSER